MASASFSFVAPLPSANSLLPGRATLAFPSSSHSASWRSRRRRGHLRPLAQGADLLGDFGARDPFPEEIESNFCEKVLGNTDTMHRILIPNISALSLAQMSCEPVSSSQPPISTEVAEKLLKKGVGLTCVRPAVRPLAPPYLRPTSFMRRVGPTFLAHGGFGLVSSGNSGTSQTEQELRNLNGAEADPTERELGNWNGAGADPTERELGNLNSAGADPTEQELGNLNGAARADPTEQELGNCDVARADPTEQELGNCDVARADLTDQELGNWDVARADPTEQELGNWDGFCQG
ncbi:hypothetical protein GW17_00018286 [Ensete ventricosum]|nr:hypothetical protein GW17_00018286 [Ensete ventricosum]